MALDHTNAGVEISIVFFTVFLDAWFFSSSFDSEYYTESSPLIKKIQKEPLLVLSVGLCGSKPIPNDNGKYTSWSCNIFRV